MTYAIFINCFGEYYWATIKEIYYDIDDNKIVARFFCKAPADNYCKIMNSKTK